MQAWPDGSAEKVFRAVYISQIDPAQITWLTSTPLLIITMGPAENDRWEETLWKQTVNVQLVTMSSGDPYGERPLIGGPRAGGQGSSQGRGLLEIEEELLKAFRYLNRDDGVLIRLRSRSEVETGELNGIVGASRRYTFEALIKDERDYPAAFRFTATDATGGDADLAWSLPAARFDRVSLVLRRDAGSTPPASVSLGDSVTVGATATSLTDSPGAGTFSYALFVGYDEDEDGTADRYSSSVTATVTVT